ncbi:beta-glucoside-specific PTS transporter subunit IIABC [Faecalicoccus pleomorphus]|uniref:beta-glucoside-specific PTS transporter subunit IIABC n=1 Tax=Faecalicoccus pleomorphus TaxID=1323 RepID=UPI0039F4EEF9
MKKYEELIDFIIKNVGGKNNILNVTHCVTRLRFQLKDESKANDDALKNNSGIITVMHSAGQYQVVIGNHVGDVYKELVQKLDFKEKQDPVKKKMKFKEKALDLISGIFMPSLSVLCACGMIKGLNTILSFAGIYTQESDLYQLINAIGDCFFYFFPIIIGYNTAKKIGMNPYTGMIIGAALCYPTINGVDLNLFGIAINVSYTSTVLPVIITCFLAYPIEKWLNKVLPSVIRSFMTPTIVLLVSVIIGFIVIGPIVNMASQDISDTLLTVYGISPVLAGILFATLWQIFVIFGVHITFIVLCMMNLSMGVPDPLLGSQVFVAFATSAVVLAILVRTKNKDLKSACIPAFVSGLFGVTEPALYGITITRPVMFTVSCIGSGISGAISGFLGFHYYQMAGLGLFEIPALLPTTDTGTVLAQAIICTAVTFIVTFIMAFVLYKEESQIEKTTAEDLLKNEIIASPLIGEIRPLSEAKDDAFASGALGKGCVIIPEQGKVYAPFDGTVLVMFPTGHAVGLVDEKGCEVLIHVGINTVQLEGKHFTPHIKVGDKVKKGQLLLDFDLDAIKQEGYATDTIVVISNTKDYSDISLINKGTITPQDGLLSIKG